jgi:hypothetical protein
MLDEDYAWGGQMEPKARFLWVCTCGFSHVSECAASEIEESLARRVICPKCRAPLPRPRTM